MADAAQFEIDIAKLIEQATARLQELAARYGVKRALRIFDCTRQHLEGVTCICGGDAFDARPLEGYRRAA